LVEETENANAGSGARISLVWRRPKVVFKGSKSSKQASKKLENLQKLKSFCAIFRLWASSSGGSALEVGLHSNMILVSIG
jgi:hypothetical protein